MIRFFVILVVVLQFVTSGAPLGMERPFEERADNAIRRWRTSGAAEAWKRGFVLRGPDTIMSEEVASALHRMQRIPDLDPNPPLTPRTGRIRWEDGSEMQVTLTEVVPRSLIPCVRRKCDPVKTEVRLTTLRLDTNRGPAQVPAWRIEVAGLPGPIHQVAVASEFRRGNSIGGTEIEGYFLTTGNTLNVQYGHGACDQPLGPRVREERDVVVVDIDIDDSFQGPCPAILLIDTAQVTLNQPLGVRVVLDADSGASVGYRMPYPRWR